MGNGKGIAKLSDPYPNRPPEPRIQDQGSSTDAPSVPSDPRHNVEHHISFAQKAPMRLRNMGYSLRRVSSTKAVPNNDEMSVETSLAGSSSSQEVFPLEERSLNRSEKKEQTNVITLPSSVYEDVASPSTLRRVRFSLKNRRGVRRADLIAFWHGVQDYLVQRSTFLQYDLTFRHTSSGNTGVRHIRLGQKRPLINHTTGKPFEDNTIRSNKYTLWSFFPMQLFAQFSKFANVYFLCVSILQLIPGLSTTGTYTTIVPLMFFVGISIAKEGYEDRRRHRLDKAENTSLAVIFDLAEAHGQEVSGGRSGPNWQPMKNKKWQEIQVGDIILLARNEAVPADLVLLQSSNVNGNAYLETTALDGETNLKCKTVPPELSQLGSAGREPHQQLSRISRSSHDGEANLQINQSSHEQDVLPLQQKGAPRTRQHNDFPRSSDVRTRHKQEGFASQMVSNRSNVPTIMSSPDFYKITSWVNSSISVTVETPNLDLYSFNGKALVDGEDIPLNNSEVVYRGSILRNTPWVLGLVVYSGEECKIRMNASRNIRVKAPKLQGSVNKVVLMIVIFVFSLAIGNTVAYQLWKSVEHKSWYLIDASVSFVPILFSFIILFNTMIPLSLYVSLEIVKMFQMFLMQADLDMYDSASDTPMESRTTTINEELGQVKYILSDKTGTLTNNSMRFRKMSVLGSKVLHESKSQESMVPQSERLQSPTHTRTHQLLLHIHAHPDTAYAKTVNNFLLSIALCHTVIPEVKNDGSADYQATSPDEAALVTAAEELGYVLIDRRGQYVAIRRHRTDPTAGPFEEVYQILDVIEFSSERKRMSVIVRTPQGRIYIFCKGADSTVTPLLRVSTLASDKAREVARREQVRKSIEAEKYLRSSIDMASHRSSASRSSFGIERLSLSSMGRTSFGTKRAGPCIQLEERRNQASLMPGRLSSHNAPHASSSQARTSRDHSNASDETSPQFGIIPSDDTIYANCLQHIQDFATEGLRTLMYGHRLITESEYLIWKRKFQQASTSLVDRQSKIERAAEEIEHSFELTGATAIEDKLQAGVSETIDLLRRAGIKIAMLTGDKSETAINIGRASNLILSHSYVTILNSKTPTPLSTVLTDTIRSLSSPNHLVSHSAIVIDGATLSTITSSPGLTSQFTHLFADLASTYICTRLSPSQKAQLVMLLRQAQPQATTLAIGDGSNDIAMIREAHIGIGITAAKEGLQAARTADYTIAQFRFLAKLLLVHGRWNYMRTCKYVLGTFWKEMLFYMTQAWWQIHCGWTGTSLYESWSLTLFNTLFTSLPVIFLGIFEQDYTKDILLRRPELYQDGQQNRGFNIKIYLLWALTAIAESALLSFSMVALYTPTTQTTTTSSMLESSSSDLFALGTLSFSACIIIIATKLQFIEISNKSWTTALAIGLSTGGWALWNAVLAGVYSNNSIYDVRDGFLKRWGKEGAWWLVLLLILAEVWLFEFIVLGVRRWLNGKDPSSRRIDERESDEDE